MRKPRAGLAWLNRYGLRLVLTGLACCLTSQVGPGQAPIIVNRLPVVLGPPQDVAPALPAVLEFGPSRPPLPPSVLEFEPAQAPLPPASVLVFEPAQAPLPPVPSVPKLESDRRLLITTPSFPSYEAREPPMPTIFSSAVGPGSVSGSQTQYGNQSGVPAHSRVPVFASPLAIPSDYPLAAPWERPTFGNVIGLRGSSRIDNPVTFLRPVKVEVTKPFGQRQSPTERKETNPPAEDFSDPIPPSFPLPQPLFHRD